MVKRIAGKNQKQIERYVEILLLETGIGVMDTGELTRAARQHQHSHVGNIEAIRC